ncbi:MAG: glycosyltransferase family 2 protein [Actinomycetota bacterium]
MTSPEPSGGDSAVGAPRVAAIMPARDDATHIAAAIGSFLSQRHAGELAIAVGLAPSTDGTARIVAEMAAADPRITVADNPSGRTAAGLNAALRAIDADVVVRVDAHCELPPGYVARAVETLGRTGAANVGGIQRAEGSTPYQRAVARAMTSRFGVGDSQFHFGGDEGPTDTVYLGVFDAAALRAAGGFDESLVRNQDYELNWRLRQAGHQVWFDPELAVRYRPRSTIGGLARQYFQYGQWKREVLRRHPRSAKPRQLVAPLTLVGVLTGLIGAATGRRWMLLAPATYATAVAAAAAADSSSPEEAGRLATVYPTMHMSWGAGFLVGPGSIDEPPDPARDGQH